MEIRIAKAADAASLVQFNQAMAIETEGKRLDDAVLTRGVNKVFLDANKGFYVAAEEDGAIVGGLMVTYEWSDWRDAWFWWIQSVYIKPEARGKGLYRQMYEFVKDQARQKGDVCGFRLYVETENKNAQGVYDKVGMSASHYLMYEEEML
jgi:GNAT superfamily N-acetyltransferase